MPKGYTNIVFDFDGTLVDSKWDIAGAQRWVLQQLGVHAYTEEDLFPYIGKPLEHTFAIVLPDRMRHRIPEAAVLYRDYYQPRSLQRTTLFPGVKETLEVLVRKQKRLAVASIKRGVNIRRIADHFGIGRYFDQLQGSEGIPQKPDPTVLQRILAAQRWEPGSTLMVGDTENDVLVGRNAGIDTCAVTYGSLTREQLLAYAPDYLISDFPEILSVVQ